MEIHIEIVNPESFCKLCIENAALILEWLSGENDG